MRGLLGILALGLAACSGDFEPSNPPMMGANEMQPEKGLFTGPTGEAVLYGGKFPEAEEDGALEPTERPTGSPYRNQQ
ncbi:MAG: hypothetical protein OIF40_06285 [Mangrovicoccus sp.]|nr:hypothetical protein [Mangrovicoccus sp.]